MGEPITLGRNTRKICAVMALVIGAGYLWPLIPDGPIAHTAWALLLIAAAIALILPRRKRKA